MGPAVPRSADFHARVAACRICPRLVAHREAVAREPPRRYRGLNYWAQPVPSFGDEGFRLLIVGLAPAAHGANRTGRMFTGDRSGEWLYEALHRFGFSSAPHTRPIRKTGFGSCKPGSPPLSTALHPGIAPPGMNSSPASPSWRRNSGQQPSCAWSSRSAPSPSRAFLRTWKAIGRETPAPAPKFGHGARAAIAPEIELLASYHPSQQNTFTGRLTRPMFHRVFADARRLAGG